MFCPKCGMQNPDTGKFCRSCGTDLGNVSTALSGNLPAQTPQLPPYYLDRKGRIRSNDPTEIWSQAIRSLIMGFGFLVVSIVLFTTNVAGGNAWWWAMLFPAFSLLAVGASQLAKVSRMEKLKQNNEIAAGTQPQPNQIYSSASTTALPPSQTDYVRPEKSIYDTGELAAPPAPSVTEDTTRHLEINNEGETMTLPKK
jgi:hypothetical protein